MYEQDDLSEKLTKDNIARYVDFELFTKINPYIFDAILKFIKDNITAIHNKAINDEVSPSAVLADMLLELKKLDFITPYAKGEFKINEEDFELDQEKFKIFIQYKTLTSPLFIYLRENKSPQEVIAEIKPETNSFNFERDDEVARFISEAEPEEVSEEKNVININSHLIGTRELEENDRVELKPNTNNFNSRQRKLNHSIFSEAPISSNEETTDVNNNTRSSQSINDTVEMLIKIITLINQYTNPNKKRFAEQFSLEANNLLTSVRNQTITKERVIKTLRENLKSLQYNEDDYYEHLIFAKFSRKKNSTLKPLINEIDDIINQFERLHPTQTLTLKSVGM